MHSKLGPNFQRYGEVETQDYAVNSSSINELNLTRDDNGRITQKTETVNGVTSDYIYTDDPKGSLLLQSPRTAHWWKSMITMPMVPAFTR